MTDEQKLVDYLRGVTTELRRSRDQLREEQERKREPIAIIGMGCRYAGGADTPDTLWHLVLSESDAVTGFPTDRGWDLKRVHNSDVANLGTSYTCAGGFLDDVAGFDPEFFGLTPHEALATDPQHRILLEVAWEAVEHAMIDPTTLAGTTTGVYVGGLAPDYGSGMTRMPPGISGLVKTGRLPNMLSGRISYALGLTGPSLTVDTGCSSSTAAIHLACQALRAENCSLALAGGAMVYATPEMFVEFSKLRFLSRDGRCKSYAAAGDGIGWGEGAGVLVLERLSDARRNGHPVLAVVRGSALTNDGRSNGITAPNGLAQQQMIRQALASAGVAAGEVDIVEGHGTGTLLGDAIEVRALLATYGTGRDRPLWLGSVKSNIAHAQAAAGVAGVVKMVMAIRHGIMPRTLHVDAPVPHVDWSSGTVRLLTAAMPWPDTGRPRTAAVSSTGISGTNGHLILQEAPAAPHGTRDTGSAGGEKPPWVLSGHTPAALRAQAQRLRDHLANHPELDTPDIAYSLATTRTAFPHRAAITTGDRAERLHALAALASGGKARGLATAPGATALAHPVDAYLSGRPVDWAAVFAGTGARRVALPTYAFQRHRFWLYDHQHEAEDAVLRSEGVEDREAITFAGLTVRTNNATELEGTSRITDLWEVFTANDLNRTLTAAEHRTLRAVYTDYDSDLHGDYTYLLGYQVDDEDAVPDGVESRTLPAARYAVFTSGRGPLISVIAAAWRRIWAMSAEQLGGKRTYVGDFEIHETHDPNPQEVQVRIHVGIE